MIKQESPQPGHWPTLIASFLHFDLSFMLWVLLGALGIYIAESAHLSPAQKGIVVAIPILSGSLMRAPMGLLSDRFGGKRIGALMLGFLFLPLIFGWLGGNSINTLFAVGLMLGTAGASFAVALPLASRWYPAERQGLVMGIAAAGNSGTVIANLLAPRLANIVGWHQVLGLAMIPLALVLLAFLLMARDNAPERTSSPLRRYLTILHHSDLWWLCLYYSITFGGYVGLSSSLPLFFRDQYALTPANAGYLTALAAFVGSGVRPLGGYVADKIGGSRLLSVLLFAICIVYALASRLPTVKLMALLVIGGMACLGLGNGAVFQLVPQRFREQIGVATGIIGGLGGVGGFFLPTLLGYIKQLSGSFSAGFMVLAAFAFCAALVLRVLIATKHDWRRSWREVEADIVPVEEPVAEAA
jgi:NNP family nitrate/nitrite transporter-like MFS transporter